MNLNNEKNFQGIRISCDAFSTGRGFDRSGQDSSKKIFSKEPGPDNQIVFFMKAQLIF